MNLIAMTKDGEFIPVHPDALAEHERLGWVQAPAVDVESLIEQAADAGPATDPAAGDMQDDPEADPDATKPATIEKGPRGLFFVMQDGKRVSRGFATLEDAEASLKVEG
jgi:hypothetical protein